MPTHKLTNEIIIAAITGFEAQKAGIDLQIADLQAMLDGDRFEPAAMPKTPKRRRMSATARKRIGDAQRKRWAESKGQSESSSSPVATALPKPKRRLSAAGKAAIVAALRKRWAAKKAAAVKTAPAATRKSTARKAAAKRLAKKAGGKGSRKRAAARASDAGETSTA
jgi:hypothetical protein